MTERDSLTAVEFTEKLTRRIPDEVVAANTGRTFAEWEDVLDDWQAVTKGFNASVRFLRNEYELSSWWSNTITARYQWSRGVRTVR